MSARGIRLAPSEIALGRSLSEGGAGGDHTPAVILGRDEETRLLLRGLLRLHRHPVVHEATTVEELGKLPSATGHRILLYDVLAGDDRWAAALTSVLEQHPDMRAVVILPPGATTPEGEAQRAGARAVLARPFAIQEFARALERTSD